MLIDLEPIDVAILFTSMLTALLVTLAFIALLVGNAATLVRMVPVYWSVETWITLVVKLSGKDVLVLDTAT